MSDGMDALFNEDNSEPVEKPVTTDKEGPARDEAGRFAATQPVEQRPAEAAPVASAAPVAATPAPEAPKAEPGHVPISALLDEREKRQRFERELTELRAQRQQPETVPSVTADPEAYAQYQRDLVDRTRTSTIFDVSETMAREKHGDAPVQTAMDWALQRSQESPAFAAEYLKQKHPIDWAVRQHKRDALVSQLGDDPDAWVRKRAEELGITVAATQAPQGQQAPASPQPAAPKPTPPRPSLASAVSAGGMQTVPVVPPFESVFKG